MKRIYKNVFLILFLTLASHSFGQLPFSANFTGFDGSGFVPSPATGQLDSDVWRVIGMSTGAGTFGGTHDSGDFARGITTGGVGSGGTYAFDNSGNIGIGFQPTGSDFTPGEITLKIENNTGSTITDLTVTYDILVNNDQGRGNTFNFAYSTDDAAYTPVASLDYTSPEVADALGFQVVNRSTLISGLNIPSNGFIYLQWQSNDALGGGSRDELGLDNVSVTVGGGAPSIHFTSINPTTESITIQNLGTVAQDISTYWLCTTGAVYSQISTYTPTGDFNLDPNESVTIDLSTTTSTLNTIPDANGSLGLFTTNTFTSSDPAILLDFIQWGAINQFRVSQAVVALRWDDANNFVSGTPPYTFTGTASDHGSAFWQDAITEPDNHVTGFTMDSKTTRTIALSWTDATGTNLPEGYLIRIIKSGVPVFSLMDGVSSVDELDFTDGYGQINVLQGVGTLSVEGLEPNAMYTISITPYGAGWDYKLGSVPFLNITTDASVSLNQTKNFDDNSLTSGDWYAISTEGDGQQWGTSTSGANGSSNAARMNGFSGGTTQANTDWLISPPIDFSTLSAEVMSFYTRRRFQTPDADDYLKLYYSTDYTGIGDPSSATLTELMFTLPSAENMFTASGNIDLSTITGTGYLIFEYKSTDNAVEWLIDEIFIGEPTYEFQITEVWAGQSGTDVTEDWFEIKNTGTVAWVSGTDTDLYYLDDSNIASEATLIEGITDIQPNEIVIVVIGKDTDATNFSDTWSPDANLTGIKVGYSDGNGIGGNDEVELWEGDANAGGTMLTSVAYTGVTTDGASYDYELGEESMVGNANGAVATTALGGNATDTPAIGSPGNQGPAPTTATIAEARNATNGDVLTITGIATTPNFGFMNGEFYVQDATAGIKVRVVAGGTGPNDLSINMGDEVTITGVRGENASEIRIEPATANEVVVNSSNNALPDAMSINGTEVTTTNTLQGSRVTLTSVTVKAGEAWPTSPSMSSGTNVVVIADGAEFILRIDRGESFFDGSTEPSGEFTLTGVLGRFNDDAQVFPFVESDIATTTTSLSNELANAKLTVFPNPTKDIVRVEIEGQASDEIKANIYSVLGKKVFEGEYKGNEFEMNIENLETGKYILILEVGKEKVARRLIKN